MQRVHNVTIHTMDQAFTSADALVHDQGNILAVGPFSRLSIGDPAVSSREPLVYQKAYGQGYLKIPVVAYPCNDDNVFALPTDKAKEPYHAGNGSLPKTSPSMIIRTWEAWSRESAPISFCCPMTPSPVHPHPSERSVSRKPGLQENASTGKMRVPCLDNSQSR